MIENCKLKIVGELLKSEREKLGLSIKEVELNIRIRSKYIEAFETMDYARLPDDVYTKGFLKNYTEYLGIDYNDALALFEKSRSIENKIIKSQSKVKSLQPIKKPRILITPKLITGTLVLLALSAVVGFLLWQFSIFTAPPTIVIDSPQNNSTIDSATIVLSGTTNEEATVYVNDIEIKSSEGVFREVISLQNGANIIKIASVNKLNKRSEKSITVMARLLPLSIAPMPIAFKGIEIKVTAGDYPITLDAVIDDNDKVHQFLMPGTVQVFKGNTKISLVTSNAKSTMIIISNEKMFNKDLGFLLPPDKKVEGSQPIPKPEPKNIEFSKDVEIK
ncbi:MAG: transcriptional regulator, XRE family [candidate division CPR2 bacterium GW2011_GWC1_39_9]|nr:MAG: transcriptional regulator, XRE family [candidate division CPR2 bacterium GW2011_GWC1_39_9]